MPCRVSSDVHEWIHEGPAVPARNPVNPHNLDEQSRNPQRGEKTPWSFTAACRWGVALDAERRWELMNQLLRELWRRQWNTTLLKLRP